MVKELGSGELRYTCDPSRFDFETTAQLEPLNRIIGQERAIEALKLVGDRFDLTQRQRTAVMRCACSDESLAARRGREVGREEMEGGRLVLDGYNVLTTIEALDGGKFERA